MVVTTAGQPVEEPPKPTVRGMKKIVVDVVAVAGHRHHPPMKKMIGIVEDLNLPVAIEDGPYGGQVIPIDLPQELVVATMALLVVTIICR